MSKKPERREHKLQAKLVTWLWANVRPEVHWFAIPNGELRHVRVALRLKEEGVKKGTPDLCFLLQGGRTAWLEMKVKGGGLSDEQKGFSSHVVALGHYWGVAKTIPEAVALLDNWNVLKNPVNWTELPT